jgi:hypothetical protein
MSSVTFLWFKLVAADGAVGRAEVARFPGFVQRAEGVGDVLGELWACGGVDGIGAREGFPRVGFRMFLRGFNMGIVGYQIRVFLGVTELFLGVLWL